MPAERPPFNPSSTTDPTIPSQRPNREPESNITALPQMNYPEIDPWAKYSRPSTDTIDDIPTPTITPSPPHHPQPTVTVTEQTPSLNPSTTLPPPYTARQKSHRKSRFPVKAQTASSAQSRENTVTINGTPNATFHEIPLDPTQDVEKTKLATQFTGLQGAWRSRRWKLVISAGFAVVVTTIVIVTALELTKTHPEEFGKI